MLAEHRTIVQFLSCFIQLKSWKSLSRSRIWSFQARIPTSDRSRAVGGYGWFSEGADKWHHHLRGDVQMLYRMSWQWVIAQLSLFGYWGNCCLSVWLTDGDAIRPVERADTTLITPAGVFTRSAVLLWPVHLNLIKTFWMCLCKMPTRLCVHLLPWR